MAEKIAGAGFHSKGILFPGHGRSVEDLRKVRFSDLYTAAENAVDELAQNHSRISLCGLSLGGLICLILAKRKKISNLVLYAPFLVPGGKTFGLPNRWVNRFLPSRDRLIPKTGTGPIFDPAALQNHIAYDSMPMPGLLENCKEARKIWKSIPQITNPTLVFQSPHDLTSHPSGAERLIRELGSRDKKLLVVPNGKHILTLDYDRERIEKETVEWLGKRRG